MKKLLILVFSLVSITSYSQDVPVKVHHKYLDVVYDTEYHAPLYSFYFIDCNESNTVVAKRSPAFHQDFTNSVINSHLQSNGSDYAGSHYDKGHLSPDRAMLWNDTAEYDCMTYINVAPQWYSFNRGIWKSIEEYTLKNTCKYDSEVVYTGCIYKSNNHLGKIKIPDYYFKVVTSKSKTVKCYVAENKEHTDKVIEHYSVSLDSLKSMLDEKYEDILSLK